MPDFRGIWDNVLLSFEILRASRENKSEFAQKGQGKLEQNPPVGAQYTPLILASRAAVDLFITAKDGTSLGLQKAATQRLDAMLPVIRSTGEVLEGHLKSAFETDVAVITEFFPNGRTAISNAKRGDVISALNNWVSRADERQGVLGAGWLTRLTNLRTQWTNNLDAQSGFVSRVDGARTDFESSWITLSWAFFDVVHQLYVDNPRNPEVADMYFDFSMFTGKTNSGNDGEGLLLATITTMAGEPITNVSATVLDQQGQIVHRGTTEDSNFFKSPSLPVGFYDLQLEHPGYVTRVQQFEVFDNNDPVNEIKLTSL